MADRRIDQLTQSESVNDDDLFVIWKKDISQTRALKMESIMPVGALIPFYSDIAPEGWLMCDGTDTTGTSNELRLYHPKLYEILGNSNVLPDLRECTLVGAGQSARAILSQSGHSHDVYALGEFKDDQFQGHCHGHDKTCLWPGNAEVYQNKGVQLWGQISSTEQPISNVYTGSYFSDDLHGTPRPGTTTHGKQIGVNFIIKC